MTIGHNSQTQFDDLPASMQEVAETLGLGMVFALVEHFGGVELRIPNTLSPGHKLMVLGQQQAEMLCQYYATETIHVPVSLIKKSLRPRVAELERRGLKRWQIARELKITHRHVRRLANSETPKKDDRQDDLFENE